MSIRVINVIRDRAPAADGTFETDLQPLALHGLLISVRASATAANQSPLMGNVLNMLTNIVVSLAGTTLWQSSLTDLFALMPAIIGRSPVWYGNGAADNDLSQARAYIPFGRTWAGGKWAIPATPAGQLKVAVTEDVAVSGYDTLHYDIDAVHNDNLTPDGFLRVTTLARTAASTGDLDIDLPVGRWLSGLSVFTTTNRITQTGANGIDRLKLLVDAIEQRYPTIEWGNAQLINWLGGGTFGMAENHLHVSDVAAAYTQFQATQRNDLINAAGNQYAHLDFDPSRSGEELLDLTACSRCTLRATMGTAEAMRVFPIEWWPNTLKT